MRVVHITDLDTLRDPLRHIIAEYRHQDLVQYVDVRVSASEGIGAYSEDGMPRATAQDWHLSLGVRVLAGETQVAAGYYGRQLGVREYNDFVTVLREALEVAHQRAIHNAKAKEQFVTQHGAFGAVVSSTELAPITVCEDVVAAEFDHDPRTVTPDMMTQLVTSAAQQAKASHPFVRRVEVVANTGIERQLFASSEGAYIDQSWCSTGGTVFVVAQDDADNTPADLYHHTGNQLGLEALTQGKNTHEETFDEFAKHIAHEAVLLSQAPPAPATDKPTTVVLDPDLVALFAHEIIGHPSELDRALKMETGYAGRSWFFGDFDNNMIGKQIGSPLLSAFSDPTLKGGYGYYEYDDEGTPSERVYHIKNGVYHEFMNSRQTAAITGSKPNGHYKANDASVVPLIRMSVSAIEAGTSDPADIIKEVEEGFYCVGHRIPSISESRENFQIAPRLIYEIKNGEIGQVYRDGRVTADSRAFFNSIDALGTDFKVFAIPNCGKGQPMQTKQVGNGGPTARAQAMIASGA